jgi:Uma2 family endonuclease
MALVMSVTDGACDIDRSLLVMLAPGAGPADIQQRPEANVVPARVGRRQHSRKPLHCVGGKPGADRGKEERSMRLAAKGSMTSTRFLAWAMSQPEGRRHELVAGEVVAMAPERWRHALTKAAVWRALDDAVRAAGLPCVACPDGMAVEIDAASVYEPDALVRCGEPLDDDAVKVTDPIIVVEVVSPSSEARDTGVKLADYARVPTLRHYLIVDPKAGLIVHHKIENEAVARTRIVRSGILGLDPPGIEVAVEAIFGGA